MVLSDPIVPKHFGYNIPTATGCRVHGFANALIFIMHLQPVKGVSEHLLDMLTHFVN